MINEYLKKRKNIVLGLIDEQKELIEKRQFLISELYNQIDEITKVEDEASEIFSVKAREDNNLKKQEIINIENKIQLEKEQKNENEKQLHILTVELKEIEEWLLQSEKGDVSRETSMAIQEYKQIRSDIEQDDNCLVNKLLLCKSLLGVDNQRAQIELDNLIRKLK